MGKTPSAPADKIAVRQVAPCHEIVADSSDNERTISEGYVGTLFGGSQTQDGNLEGESTMVLHADKITVRQAAPCHEIVADSSNSERTISEGSVGIMYGGIQTQDGDLEGESAMVLPVVGDRSTTRSNSHGYTRSLEIDSASHTERTVARSASVLVAQRRDCIQIYPEWLDKIDSGKGMWTAFKQFRADGKHEEYYLHKEYSHRFCSKCNVIEFIGNGTVKGKPVQKRSADTSTDNLQDYRRPTKRQRMKAQTSSSSLSTGAQTTTTSTKLPHGFI